MDRDLEAVPLCPVIDESRGDKERGKDREKAGKREGGTWKHRGEDRAAQGIFTTCSQTEQGLRGSAPARNVSYYSVKWSTRKFNRDTAGSNVVL